MLGIAFALACSASWGVSDFLGGYLGRRMAVLRILFASQGLGLLVGLLFAVLLSGGGPPTEPKALFAFGAGIFSVLGVGALYRGLSLGTMGVVAPIAALSALIPVAVGLSGGDSPSALQTAGMLLALGGVVVTTRDVEEREDRESRSNRPAIVFAFLAAVCFGTVQVCLDAGASVDVNWTIGYMRIASVCCLLGFTLTVGPGVPRPASYQGAPIPLLVLTGLLDFGAASFYAAATTYGQLSVVAVLGSLYPVVTVLLAHQLLAEHLNRRRALGAIATLGGVVLLSAG